MATKPAAKKATPKKPATRKTVKKPVIAQKAGKSGASKSADVVLSAPVAVKLTLTPKQEAFCLAYLETGNASEAYRRAYSAARMKTETVNRESKQLIDNHKITARIDELRAPAVAAAQISLTEHLNDLKRLRDAAEKDAKYGAAITAEVSRGRASGLYVEHLVIENTVSVKDFTGKGL